MTVQTYTIRWSQHGERGKEDAAQVQASRFADEGDFIDFYVEEGEMYSRRVLRVRASDVQQIEQTHE